MLQRIQSRRIKKILFISFFQRSKRIPIRKINARLTQAWTASTNINGEWLQFNLENPENVASLIFQSRADADEWIQYFNAESIDENNSVLYLGYFKAIRFYDESSKIGNYRNIRFYAMFNQEVNTKTITIRPTQSSNYISTRVGLVILTNESTGCIKGFRGNFWSFQNNRYMPCTDNSSCDCCCGSIGDCDNNCVNNHYPISNNLAACIKTGSSLGYYLDENDFLYKNCGTGCATFSPATPNVCISYFTTLSYYGFEDDAARCEKTALAGYYLNIASVPEIFRKCSAMCATCSAR